MISDQLLRPVQFFLIKQKPLLLQIFFASYILLVATYVFGFWAFTMFAQQFSILLELGGKFGVCSLGFYAVSLLPGILKRLQVLPMIQVSLMLFRRQFGILMFLFAINHSGYSTIFPTFALTGSPPAVLSTREIFGFVAELVLFPLFITSNDIAVRRLGTWWKVVHKLTYVALLFIFGHIVLLGGSLELKAFMGGLLLLELISWIVYFRRKQQIPNTPLAPVQTL